MKRPGRTTSVRKLVQLARTDSPIASELSGHDVKVVVRHFLAAVHAVVLKRENPQRLVGCQQRMGHVSRGFDDGRSLFVSQLQQRPGVAACDDTALTDLELHRGNDGNREFGLCDYRNVGSSRQRFTDFTWLLSRQLDHVARTRPELNIKPARLVARCAGARLRDHRDDRVDHYLRPYLLDRMCGARNSGVDAARRQGGQLVVAEIDHFDGLR